MGKITAALTWLLCLGLTLAPSALAETPLLQDLNNSGQVLMVRHAYAPGSGDPANFELRDCATQRNLNAEGRDQARRIGQWLRARGVMSARIFSSQWCRCLDTAEGMALGRVTELPALNSFFQRPEDREPNLRALRRFLADQPRSGRLIVLVTHYVTIAGITGEAVGSGEGVLLQLQPGDGWTLQGHLDFGLRE